jgi:hypothetical protein
MTINWAFSIGAAAIAAVVALGPAGSALAQACTRDGPVVMCNDGRRGLLSGDARSSLTPHPSVIIGNKASVIVGQGVFVGQGKGVVPLDNPSAPNKMRCATLDGASYCNQLTVLMRYPSSATHCGRASFSHKERRKRNAGKN